MDTAIKEISPNGALPDEKKLARSVKKDDNTLGLFFLPAYGQSNQGALPQYLPPYDYYTGDYVGYYSGRQQVLLSTFKKEAMWAVAKGVALSKMVSLAWQIESDIPRRRKRWQQMLLNAGAGSGLFGWVPFLSAGLGSYLATGLQFIEIERATPANGSKVINIHHLNPLRCNLTNNAQYPVTYLADNSKAKRLAWHQVIVIADSLDPTEGILGQVQSAAERAYDQIKKLAAIELMIYERVTGTRPNVLQFVSGISRGQMEDVIKSSTEDAMRRGLQLDMGAVVVPVMSDIPLNLVTVPLKDFPDGFTPTDERNRADVIYANAIGLDPQDLNPQLIGRQGLGSTGNQSVVLAEKQKGRGLAAWASQFQHMMNELVLDDKSLFTFQENDIRDEMGKADVGLKRQQTRDNMIKAGMISPEEARNLAVDEDDLPNEFIQEDSTHQGTISDLDKPEEEKPKKESVEVPEPPEPKEQPKKEKAIDLYKWSKSYY